MPNSWKKNDGRLSERAARGGSSRKSVKRWPARYSRQAARRGAGGGIWPIDDEIAGSARPHSAPHYMQSTAASRARRSGATTERQGGSVGGIGGVSGAGSLQASEYLLAKGSEFPSLELADALGAAAKEWDLVGRDEGKGEGSKGEGNMHHMMRDTNVAAEGEGKCSMLTCERDSCRFSHGAEESAETKDPSAAVEDDDDWLWVSDDSTTADTKGGSNTPPPPPPPLLRAMSSCGNEDSFDCPVCYGEVNPGEGVLMQACGRTHGVCRPCLKSHIETQASGGNYVVACPIGGCDETLSQREVRRVLGQSAFGTFDRRELDQLVAVDQSLHICPSPDCPFIVSWAGEDADGAPIMCCPLCEETTCLVCRKPAVAYYGLVVCACAGQEEGVPGSEGGVPSGKPVNSPASLARLAAEEKATASYMAGDEFGSDVRICARCTTPVLKASGCSKMKCRCGYRFCFECGVENAQCEHTPKYHGFIDNVTGGGDFSNLADKTSPEGAPPRAARAARAAPPPVKTLVRPGGIPPRKPSRMTPRRDPEMTPAFSRCMATLSRQTQRTHGICLGSPTRISPTTPRPCSKYLTPSNT